MEYKCMKKGLVFKERIVDKSQCPPREYCILCGIFQGLEITFRHCLLTDTIEVKLDDAFAMANGYADLNDMLSKESEMKEGLLKCNLGLLPEWILVNDKGNFLVLNKSKMN